MAVIQKTDKTGVSEDVEKFEPSCITGRSVKWCNHLGRRFVSYSKNIELSYNIAVLLLHIYPREMKHVYTKACTQML